MSYYKLFDNEGRTFDYFTYYKKLLKFKSLKKTKEIHNEFFEKLEFYEA